MLYVTLILNKIIHVSVLASFVIPGMILFQDIWGMKYEKKIALFLLILGLIGLSISVFAAPVEVAGKVISVVDGNTLDFRSTENEEFRFVLAGIDCPELNQEYGHEAKQHLEKLLLGKEAILTVEKKDRLGNKVGGIRLPKGKDPRIELLEKGLAWTQETNPNTEFEALKEEAKIKGKGLWKQENPQAPWTFRRQQTMLTAKSS